MTAGIEQYLAGKHAVVTGGGRGIGAAIATALAAHGANLTLMGRDLDVLDAHAERLGGVYEGRFEAVQCDVADEASVSKAFATARERFGEPYVLVNNAGQADSAAFTEMPRAMWDRLLTVNLTSQFVCIREVLPAMAEARAGRIVNIASTAGLKGYATIVAYCASKHGVIGLTRALAVETAKLGVTVNAVCPSYTADTGMAQQAVDNIVRTRGKTPEEAWQMLTRPIPRGLLTKPEEVANAVAWLCAPGAAAVTGQSIVVAGGEVM